MIETFLSVTNIAFMALTQCVDIQIPYLINPIAFIRFEGQSLPPLLQSLNIGDIKTTISKALQEGL